MRHDLKVSGTIEINAEPARVWEALTNPEIIKEYLYGTETVTDWKTGSEIIFQGEYQGQKYRDKGIVKEIVPRKTLSYTYWSGFTGLEDKPENYSLITYNLVNKGGGKTDFTWTQEGFADEQGYQHSKNGTAEILKKIKTVVEK